MEFAATENLISRHYAIEMSYVDVTINRARSFTGQEHELFQILAILFVKIAVARVARNLFRLCRVALQSAVGFWWATMPSHRMLLRKCSWRTRLRAVSFLFIFCRRECAILISRVFVC